MRELYGRRVLMKEIQEHSEMTSRNIKQEKALQIFEGLQKRYDKQQFCLRCGSDIPKEMRFWIEETNSYYRYCSACLIMGCVSQDEKFYHIPEPNQFEEKKKVLSWQGTLTKAQRIVADAVEESVKHNQRLLVWAVSQ